MNRREHLLVSAPRVAAWSHHSEHLIVDWSSRNPLRRQDLPDDPRLRLLRVEGEKGWNLCRAYNFALARAQGDVLLKLDADAWPSAAFDPADPDLLLPDVDLCCAFGSGPEGRKGQLLIAADLVRAVGGFHELMEGYGFDDKDLEARLRLATGHEPRRLPVAWLEVLRHGDEERAGQPRASGGEGQAISRGQAAMRASLRANRLVAAHCPWGPRRPSSRYLGKGEGLWQLDPASRPQPPLAVAAELADVRRLTFWGFFLWIPEAAIEGLPYSLFPPIRPDGWPVRRWHRLWWHTGRRLLWWSVQAVMACRSLLLAGRRAGAQPPGSEP